MSRSVLILGVSLGIMLSGAAFAETHVIEGTQDVTWRSGGNESTIGGAPLIVEVAKGDILDIQILPGPIPHGVVTLDKAATEADAAAAAGLVIQCGEDEKTKPDAVLREIECGATSNFNIVYTGSMKLEVLDKFSADTHFWCIAHLGAMWGTIKLKADDAAANTHVIEGTQDITWKSGDQESTTAGAPLVVEVAKGDIVDIQIAAGPAPHGLVTIDKPATDASAAKALGLVLACGENAAAKPDAVLRETECGAASQLDKIYTGSMKLEVLDTFSADTHFWCIVHFQGMWGTLKLKSS